MEYRRVIERTFEGGGAPELRIANDRGSLTVRGEQRDDVALTATIRVRAGSDGEADEMFGAIDLPMSAAGGAIQIGPPRYTDDELEIGGFLSWIRGRRRQAKVDLVVAVPRGCRVVASNRSGPTSVEGVHADVTVDAHAGGIELHEIEGDVSASTHAGGIRADSLRGPVRLEARAGAIEASRIIGLLTMETRAGRIEAERIDGEVDVSSRSGAIELVEVGGAVRVRGRSGRVEYRGPITDAVEIAVRSGAIELGVPDDASFFLDAESGHGSVVSELDVDVTKEPEAGAPTVHLRTESGSIRLVPAQGG